MWTYKGIDIFRSDSSYAMGIKWEAFSQWGRLRADSKQSMRQLINQFDR